MTQDNNEAASAPYGAYIPGQAATVLAKQVADWTKERDRLQDLINAASASQSSTPVPRVGGNTKPIGIVASCEDYGVTVRWSNGVPAVGTELFAHVARQRQESAAPNGIKATMRHDAGAIARCSYCGRYSLDPATLSRSDDDQPVCECGKQHGWSGSFVAPDADSKWSGKAPTPSAAVAEGVDTPEFRGLVHAWSAANEECWPSKANECRQQLIAHIETVYGAQQREAGRRERDEEVRKMSEDLAWYKAAHGAVSGKLKVVWQGIRDAVEKYSGKPCEGEPFDRLDELLDALARQPASEGLAGERKKSLSLALWCDLKTDADRSNWLLMGRGYETGVVAQAVQNDLAMAYHRLSLLSAVPPAKAEGMSDTERLDFIEANTDLQLKFHKRRWSLVGFTNYEYEVHKTAREAIDAAILAQQAKGEKK